MQVDELEPFHFFRFHGFHRVGGAVHPGIAFNDAWRVRLDVRVDGGANGDMIDASHRGSIEAAFRTLETAAAFERREMVIQIRETSSCEAFS